MAAELAAFLADSSLRCGVVLATLAEEMPVQESLELLTALQAKLGIRPDLILANALYPPLPASPGSRCGQSALAGPA